VVLVVSEENGTSRRSRAAFSPRDWNRRYTINAEEVAGLELRKTTKLESRDESPIRIVR